MLPDEKFCKGTEGTLRPEWRGKGRVARTGGPPPLFKARQRSTHPPPPPRQRQDAAFCPWACSSRRVRGMRLLRSARNDNGVIAMTTKEGVINHAPTGKTERPADPKTSGP